MFGRSTRTRLPQICSDPELLHEEIRDRDWQNTIRGKEYADLRRKLKNQQSKSVTQCCSENQQTFSQLYQPEPKVVTQR